MGQSDLGHPLVQSPFQVIPGCVKLTVKAKQDNHDTKDPVSKSKGGMGGEKEGKMYNQVLNLLILGNDSEGICSKGSGNTATDFLQLFAVNVELASETLTQRASLCYSGIPEGENCL